MVFNACGDLLHLNQRAVALLRRDGHVEQDPQALFQSVQQVIRCALEEFPRQIARLGLATQRSTVVAWDRETGIPLAPAISWQDRRNAEWLSRTAPPADELVRRTGLRASPHYGVAKLRWLLDHDVNVREAAAQGRLVMGPLAAFLLSRLVPDRPAAVDTANAARTLLLNIETGDWDADLLECFAIERQWLPQVQPVRSDFGRLGDEDIRVTTVSGDQTAALFVDGTPRKHDALVNIGSGAFVLAVTGPTRRQVPDLLSGLAANLEQDPLYYVEGTVNGAGTALDWLADATGKAVDHRHIDDTIKQVDAPPVFINGVGGLGSPWWGTVTTGFAAAEDTDSHDTAAHLAAVIESIAFLLVDNIARMREFGLELRRLLFTGGLSQVDALCQSIVDLTELPGQRLLNPEATARGTAWLAAKEHDQWIPTEHMDFTPTPRPALLDRHHRFRRHLKATLRT